MPSAHPSRASLLETLPPEWPEDLLPAIQAEVAASRSQFVIIDDDPTGTQTVRDVMVITRWDAESLQSELAAGAPGFYILTNSRSLTAPDARALSLELARNLRTATVNARIDVTLASRSDSTLRGHFPVETDPLHEELGPFDLMVFAPYFEAGGRLTVADSHFVVEGDRLIPSAETPFARDPVFGFKNSNLRHWIEEKSNGRTRAAEVASVSLDLIRTGGPQRVAEMLLALPRGTHVVVNAVAVADIEVVALATLRVEAAGRRLLLRTAASLVAARLGQRPAGCLTHAAVSDVTSGTGGLIVVGSYVPKTTEQLAQLRATHRLCAIEVNVRQIVDPGAAKAIAEAAVRTASDALARGENVVVYTARELLSGANHSATLEIGAATSRVLINIVQALTVRPRFLIAKGGITSSDIATKGLGVRRARVLGQLLPGIPVWELGAETRFPDLKYVVFPGNVGDANALSRAVEILDPEHGDRRVADADAGWRSTVRPRRSE